MVMVLWSWWYSAPFFFINISSTTSFAMPDLIGSVLLRKTYQSEAMFGAVS